MAGRTWRRRAPSARSCDASWARTAQRGPLTFESGSRAGRSRPRARALFDSLGDELEEIEVEGHRAYTLAGGEREHLVPEAVRDQLAAYPRGRYEGPAGVRFVVIDGVPAGLWERKKRGKRLELRIAPSRRLTRAERAELDAETERFGAFLGLEPAVTVA